MQPAPNLPSGPTPDRLRAAGTEFHIRHPLPFGLILEPVAPQIVGELPDFLHSALLTPAYRETFYQLVEQHGFVVVRRANGRHETYRFVRGRSSPNKLSPGEYFHHDGCSGPTKPRIVEIAFPTQPAERHIATAVARFPNVVVAMAEVNRAAGEVEAAVPIPDLPFTEEEWENKQAQVMRAVRKSYAAASAREYLREVDAATHAYVHRWQWGDSLFVANGIACGSVQHRRAYPGGLFDGRANGHLVKRWPAEELAGIAVSCPIDSLDRE